MLDFAFKYKDQIKELYVKNILGNDKYKYWFNMSYWTLHKAEIEESDYDKIERVSIFDNKILGYFKASVDREANYIQNLSIVKFDLNTISFGFIKDLEKFINELFEIYCFNKICFTVTIGNPAERLYDAFIKKYNGKTIGIFQDDVKLIDQKLYDVKYYELMRKDYLISKERL